MDLEQREELIISIGVTKRSNKMNKWLQDYKNLFPLEHFIGLWIYIVAITKPNQNKHSIHHFILIVKFIFCNSTYVCKLKIIFGQVVLQTITNFIWDT